MDCDEEQMRCEGTSNLSDEGVGFFWWGWFVTVLNVHKVHASADCPKQGLRGWQPCQQWEKSAAQIYAAVGSSKENRQRRLLTNIGLTMECPSQAGKLVRGIG